MKRKAILYRKSKDGKRAFYIDAKNAPDILKFLKSEPAYVKKFEYVMDMLLSELHPTSDLYGRENIEKGCEHIWAIKPFKGKRNPRIYCQQYYHDGQRIFVIIASELLIKKKSSQLSHKEVAMIKKVSAYQYELTNG